MSKFYFGYCFFLVPLLFYAQKIELTSTQQSLQINPGSSHVLVFKVSNLSAIDCRAKPVLTLPDSWSLTVKPNTITVPSEQNKLLFFSIRIPSTAPQGVYNIRLELFDQRTNHLLFQFKDNITVSLVKKITLNPLHAPDYVKAGDTIQGNFILKNEGNQQAAIVLASDNAFLEQKETVLMPGQTQVLTVYKPTFGQQETASMVNLKLTAQQKNDHNTEVSAFVHSKVIPIVRKQHDIYHRFPIRLSGTYIVRDHNSLSEDGFQGEIYGKGTLDRAHTKHLEFRALGPDRFSLSTFSQYEEYFANFKSDLLYVHLGDKTFSSSYLTEYARYGRGAELRIKTNHLELGGYYQQPRFFKAFEEQMHAFVTFKTNNDAFLKYGFVYNSHKEDKQDVQMMFVSGGAKLFHNILDIKSEYAFSESEKQQGNAFRIEANVALQNLNANVNYLKADPEFEGFFTDTDFFTGNIHYRFAPKWKVHMNYRKDARNIKQDTLFKVAPYNEQYFAGLSFQYSKKGHFYVNAGTQTRTDRQPVKKFDYKEKFLRFNFIQGIGKLKFNLQNEFAQTWNKLNDFKGDSYLSTLNITLHQKKGFFNVFGSYLNTTRYSANKQEQFYYGGRINGWFSKAISFSAFYQNTYTLEETYRDRNLMEAQLHYKITPKQKLSFISRYGFARGELENKDFTLLARYEVLLNMPLYKKAHYGTLDGQITNLGVAKIEGVKLYLNNKVAITDQYGRFSFVNVPPGIYHLEIDRKSIGFQDIPDVVFPIQIEITSNEKSMLDFGLTKAATIKGLFKVNTSEVSQSQGNNTLKEQIVVEISNGNEIYRKIATTNEPFDFTYLRPGNWHVKIYRNGLDKKYRIQTTQYTLSLPPGGKEFINIVADKQRQEVKYLQEPIKLIKNIKPKK